MQIIGKHGHALPLISSMGGIHSFTLGWSGAIAQPGCVSTSYSIHKNRVVNPMCGHGCSCGLYLLSWGGIRSLIMWGVIHFTTCTCVVSRSFHCNRLFFNIEAWCTVLCYGLSQSALLCVACICCVASTVKLVFSTKLGVQCFVTDFHKSE
jgi:hypothetical protein